MSKIVLLSLRKLYVFLFAKPKQKPVCVQDANTASDMMYQLLTSDVPCMIARLGGGELEAMINYVGIKNGTQPFMKFIRNKVPEWWWNESLRQLMYFSCGFFPPTSNNLEKFAQLMLEDMKELDLLGSWQTGEMFFEQELKNCPKIDLELLNPYFSKIPWTKALENKKVLIVSLFTKTMESQYQKREMIFENTDTLPAFDLKLYQSAQTYSVKNSPFKDWFEVLDLMKADIDKIDFDICLLGCGAYGFPLAAHIKRTGRKAVHMGGAVQLLFGIRGKRWENPQYHPVYDYSKLMNEYWVRPRQDETPQTANQVEGACYW